MNGLTHTPRTLIDPSVTTIFSGPLDHDIALSFRFHADTSRVFYALSIPEYIETWLQAPLSSGMRFVFHLVGEETFRADLFRGASLKAIVNGRCRVVAANQVRYVWKTTGLSDITETLVDMKILCDSAACVLALKHSGFRDTNESVWYRAMWQQSLERLGRLMEKD